MQKVLKNKQGVTLIALVVTIVILIILAGVSMAMILGNNGIFEQAKKGANSMAEAETNTQKGFNSISSEIDKIIDVVFQRDGWGVEGVFDSFCGKGTIAICFQYNEERGNALAVRPIVAIKPEVSQNQLHRIED